jgi:hypothetical protein
MKTLIFGSLFIFSSSLFAGDLYMNCGYAPIEQAEEFIASSSVNRERAYVAFAKGKFNYTITFENGKYEYLKSNSNIGGFERLSNISGSGRFKEAKIVDGIFCHIND